MCACVLLFVLDSYYKYFLLGILPNMVEIRNGKFQPCMESDKGVCS